MLTLNLSNMLMLNPPPDKALANLSCEAPAAPHYDETTNIQAHKKHCKGRCRSVGQPRPASVPHLTRRLTMLFLPFTPTSQMSHVARVVTGILRQERAHDKGTHEKPLSRSIAAKSKRERHGRRDRDMDTDTDTDTDTCRRRMLVQVFY